jgi:integrase
MNDKIDIEKIEPEFDDAMTKFEQDYLAESKIDFDEESRELTEMLTEQISGDINITISSLLDKMKISPDFEFPISDHSNFCDDKWILEKDLPSSSGCINFDDDNDQLKLLKKIILYHFIPSFHPFNRIKAYSTTVGYGSTINLLDKYIFDIQKIRTFPKDINLITERMLNEALDEAKDSEYVNHYRFLYSIISFWCFLSDNKLIPDDFQLTVNSSKIDTKERSRDVSKESIKRNNPYQSFTRNDLSILLNYALFWTDKALPHLIKVKRYSSFIGLPKYSKYVIERTKQIDNLENLYGHKIDGQEIIGFGRTTKTDRRDNRQSYSYSTWAKFAAATDKVRNGIFILVALITGLRRSELAKLKFGDFYKIENGECFVDISRFKTSNDPNYFGESDYIPIPDYIYDSVQKLNSLKLYLGNVRTGAIFQSSKSRKDTKEVNSQCIKLIASELGNECKLDGLHTHRFRKTIAEILIGHDETNIDIIRELFGHKSYAMTLRYIARNPYFIRTISEMISKHYTSEFETVLKAITSGHYSGHAAERIAKQIKNRPSSFKGSQLKITVFNYVNALMSSGEPFFLHRTPMNTFCLSIPVVGGNDRTPCVKNMNSTANKVAPDPSNCQYEECSKAAITNIALPAITDNIIFYTRILDQEDQKLTRVNKAWLKKKIKRNEQHLKNLQQNRMERLSIDDINAGDIIHE